jgi:hypothetical protein
LLVVVGIAALPSVCGAQADDPKKPEVLAKRFVDAVNSKSVESRKAILHPKSLACINAQTQLFYDWIFSRQFQYAIRPNYKSSAAAIARDEVPDLEGEADYPLVPTHQLQIDFDTGPFSGTTVVLLMVYDARRWSEVLPCPRPATIARMKAAQEEAAKEEQRLESLAANVTEPLRAELIELMKKGRRVDAIRRYAVVSGEDLATARRVVELLMPRQ